MVLLFKIHRTAPWKLNTTRFLQWAGTKTLKPYQGLKLCQPHKWVVFLGDNIGFSFGHKNPKTLSGIETLSVGEHYPRTDRGTKTLKPYQGLKPSLKCCPSFHNCSSTKTLKPYQGLKHPRNLSGTQLDFPNLWHKNPKTLSGIETRMSKIKPRIQTKAQKP